MGKGPMQETSVSIGELLDKSREESGVPYSLLRVPPNLHIPVLSLVFKYYST